MPSFSVCHPVHKGWGQACAEEKHKIFTHIEGACIYIYMHTHAGCKSPVRTPFIIWWYFGFMPTLPQHKIDYTASDKSPAQRLREGGETFQSSCLETNVPLSFFRFFQCHLKMCAGFILPLQFRSPPLNSCSCLIFASNSGKWLN